MYDGSAIVVPLESTDDLVLVFDKTIPLGCVDGEVINHTVGIDN